MMILLEILLVAVGVTIGVLGADLYTTGKKFSFKFCAGIFLFAVGDIIAAVGGLMLFFVR